jgi:hypothetical protein
MLFGNDEDVGGSLGVDIFKGEDVLVFVDFLGGNFAGDDAAEETIGIGHFPFTWWLAGRNDSIAAAGLSAGRGMSSGRSREFFGISSDAIEVVPFPVRDGLTKVGGTGQEMSVPHYLVQADQEHGAFGGLGFGG